jgi:hypothetical protein
LLVTSFRKIAWSAGAALVCVSDSLAGVGFEFGVVESGGASCVVLMIGFLRGELSFEFLKAVLISAMSTGVSMQKRRGQPNSIQKLETIRGLS